MTNEPEERMLKWFRWQHLPPHLQPISAQYGTLAQWTVDNIARGPERTIALRKLLEGKDAAVRAYIEGTEGWPHVWTQLHR